MLFSRTKACCHTQLRTDQSHLNVVGFPQHVMHSYREIDSQWHGLIPEGGELHRQHTGCLTPIRSPYGGRRRVRGRVPRGLGGKYPWRRCQLVMRRQWRCRRRGVSLDEVPDWPSQHPQSMATMGFPAAEQPGSSPPHSPVCISRGKLSLSSGADRESHVIGDRDARNLILPPLHK